MLFASRAAKERTVPWEFTASPAWPAPTRRTRFTATRATPARSARQTARRVVRRVRPDGINPRPVSWSASVASPAGSLRSLGKLRATGATRARTARPPARRPASTARPGGFSPSQVGANANSARRGDLPRVPPHAAAACNSARGARAPPARRFATSARPTTITTARAASIVPGRRRARATRRSGASGSWTKASIASRWTRRKSTAASATTAASAAPAAATTCARTTTTGRSAICATGATTWSPC